MGRVVDGRVNGAPFAGIVLTAGSVLRADDAAGPVLSKKMEDAPIAGWYTIDGGQTPEDDIIEAKTEAAGVTKANLPVAKAFLLAMFAGAFIAFGGLFFTVFLSDSTLGWGAQRVVGGLCFCLGLVLVLVCGAELFTGNSLMVCALKSKKITLVQMLKAWVVVWVGNFVGALFIVFLVYMAGIYKLNGEAVANSMVSVAAGKVTVDWVTIFFRGILCNIFVCLAVWIGTAGKTVVDKVVGILLPIAAFVACGFEHCVANMYFLPMGAVMHACGYGADVAGANALNAAGIAFNLSAATLGNIVGANVFNLVLVSGVSVALAPFDIPQSATLFGINSSLVLELPVMLLVMILLTIPALVRGRLSRVQGVALLCIYAAFCAVQFTL